MKHNKINGTKIYGNGDMRAQELLGIGDTGCHADYENIECEKLGA